MQPKNIRIKDIAVLAGVSEGTVDRVLHNRGKVSESAAEKVRQVLDEINYRPNLIARTLGTNRNYRIAALMPDHKLDPYWNQSFDGIRAGETQLAQFGIHLTVEYSFFNPHRKETFQEAALKVFHSHPDAVLVAPLFYYASIPFFKELSEAKIPFILFNTHILEANALSFIGQDLVKSGRLAAELISIGQHSKSFAVLHIDEDLINSVHLKEKERGFREYFETQKKKNDFTINTFVIGSPHSSTFRDQVTEILRTPNLSGVFVSTSKAYRVAPIIKKENPAIRIVGYDLIKENLECLQNGTIDFLINQNPMRQAKLGIQTLANYLLFNKNTPPLHLFPLEIITPQNVSTYLSHEGNLSGITV
jgi:LacI family transcriptional regulator